ncbi:MAG: hypothetical protein ABI678_04750 [Kofleriaceae bacterium]
MATALARDMTHALATIDSLDLDLVTGGKLDWNRMVDNGNRYAAAVGTAGATVGGLAGIPGGPAGMATGAGIGFAAGGALGWAGGAGYDAYQQLHGR